MDPNIPTASSTEDSPIQDRVSAPAPPSAAALPNAAAQPKGPARPKGPNVSVVVLGVVAVALAALIIANETTSLRVDWSRLGPSAIVGVGFVLVVLGAVGLIRRNDEA